MCLADCPESASAEVAGTGAPAHRESREFPGRSLKWTRSGDTVDGFLATPRLTPAPVVVVLHGNAGLPPDVTDAAIRMAALGYIGLAVSSTSREPDPSAIPRETLMSRRFGDRYVDDARAGVAEVTELGLASGRVSVPGYCGGGYTGLLWAAGPHGNELAALVGAHVGMRGRNEDGTYRTSRPHGLYLLAVASVPTQLHFGMADTLTPPADVAEVEALIERENKPAEVYCYPGADHGFAMHTNDSQDEIQALVDGRVADFLRRHTTSSQPG